jgi:hypothetical protein
LDANELLKSVEKNCKSSFEMYSNILITKMSSSYDGRRTHETYFEHI